MTGTSTTAEGAVRLNELGATGIPLDVFDRVAVSAALAAVAPDAVIHQLTALGGGSVIDNALIRQDGTRNLADAAHEAGVGRIVAQSIAWAYEPGDRPADESIPLDTKRRSAPRFIGGMLGRRAPQHVGALQPISRVFAYREHGPGVPVVDG